MSDRKVRIAGLWEHQMENGEVYFKGKINDFLSVCVFQREQENENAPKYDVVLVQKGGK